MSTISSEKRGSAVTISRDTELPDLCATCGARCACSLQLVRLTQIGPINYLALGVAPRLATATYGLICNQALLDVPTCARCQFRRSACAWVQRLAIAVLASPVCLLIALGPEPPLWTIPASIVTAVAGFLFLCLCSQRLFGLRATYIDSTSITIVGLAPAVIEALDTSSLRAPSR